MCSAPDRTPDVRATLHPDSPFRVRSHRVARNVLVIEINGDLDLFTAPLLGTSMALHIDPSDVPAHVEVDLQGLTFCDTPGLDALHAAVTGLEASGTQVTVVGAQRPVRRLLQFAAEHGWIIAGPILAAATPA